MKKVSVVVVSITTPILVGIYERDILVKSLTSSEKTSEALPMIFERLLKKYIIEDLYYANGPGSYMAIKISYMFLKTVSIAKNIPLKAVSGFFFNQKSPIKALGKKYFFNLEDGTIKIDFLEDLDRLQDFKLPDDISDIPLSKTTLPNYYLPAV